MTLRKNMVVSSYPQIAGQLKPYFGQNLIVIDPVKPDQSEPASSNTSVQIDAQQNAK